MHNFIRCFFPLSVFTLLYFFIILLIICICDLNLLPFLLDKLLLLWFSIMNEFLIVYVFFELFIRHGVAVSLLILVKHVILSHIEFDSALVPQLLSLLFPLFNTLFYLIRQFFKGYTFFRDVLSLLLFLFFLLFIFFCIRFLFLFRLFFFNLFWYSSYCWLVKFNQLRNFRFLFQIFNNLLFLWGRYDFFFRGVFGCYRSGIKTEEKVILRSLFIINWLCSGHTRFSFFSGSHNGFPTGRLNIDNFRAHFSW